MKGILAFVFWAVALSICLVTVPGFCGAEYAPGDTGIPPDYDDNLLNYRDAVQDYDAFAAQLPAAFNWKTRGKVTPAKDQGSCGSCYAFAAAGTLESKLLMKYGHKANLAEQQQISCNTNMYGCIGGDMSALRYWESDGPWLESCSKYPSADGAVPDCSSFDCGRLEWRTTNYYTVNMTVEDIKTSLYTDGPGYFRFNFYTDFYTFWNSGTSGAVYTQTDGERNGGHAVLLIGWDDGKKAWLLKNSWGAAAGPNGDGTFWMAYSGHAADLALGMANVFATSTKRLLPQKKLMFLRKPGSGKPLGIRIYRPPVTVGGSLGDVLAGSDNLGTNVLDLSAANLAPKTGDELVVLRNTTVMGKRTLALHYTPAAPNKAIGLPFASAAIESKGKYVASGDFNGDGRIEIAVAEPNATARAYGLRLYRPPTRVGGAATLIASSPDIGSDVRGITCGDYNRDSKDELFVLRGTTTASGLYVYRAPSRVGVAIGNPVASVPDLGSGILGVAAANLDTDRTNLEVAILAKTPAGKRNLKIYRTPMKVDGTLGTLVASVDSVDAKFVSVKGIGFTLR